jgi:hypothetical protein
MTTNVVYWCKFKYNPELVGEVREKLLEVINTLSQSNDGWDEWYINGKGQIHNSTWSESSFDVPEFKESLEKFVRDALTPMNISASGYIKAIELEDTIIIMPFTNGIVGKQIRVKDDDLARLVLPEYNSTIEDETKEQIEETSEQPIKVTSKSGEEKMPIYLDTKRQSIPAVIETICPNCGGKTSRDLDTDFLRYPEYDEYMSMKLYCGCGHEHEIEVKLNLFVEIEIKSVN